MDDQLLALIDKLKHFGYLLNTFEGKAKFCCDGKRCLHLYEDMKTVCNDIYITVNRVISDNERGATND